MNQICKLAPALLALTQFSAIAADWNPKLAASYLDKRQEEWFAWPAAKAYGGPCVSCHTGVTYLLARPQLRRVLGETEPTQYESGLLKALRERVDRTDPKEISPGFSKEPLASRAIGVESIFAALFLAKDDEPAGKLSASTKQAFERLWRLQQREGDQMGGWQWFVFNLDPYETSDSPFLGASLAALAVGHTPKNYRERPEVRDRIASLSDYLSTSYKTQPLQNRLALAWASRSLPGILSDLEVLAIIDETRKKQLPDGSWSIQSLGPWKEHKGRELEDGGNSYATAFAAFVLGQLGEPRSNRQMVAALNWLRSHQDRQSGSWAAASMNKQYPAGSIPEKFMTDAATAFAVLALTAQ